MDTMQRLGVDREQLAAICKVHGIRRLAVAGAATRRAKTVELRVEFQPHASARLRDLARLRRELAVLFGRPVELVPERGWTVAARGIATAVARGVVGGAVGGDLAPPDWDVAWSTPSKKGLTVRAVVADVRSKRSARVVRPAARRRTNRSSRRSS